MVAGLKGKEYAERCTELGLETLEERRHQHDMALVYKMAPNKESFKRGLNQAAA
jgi:hypothetical protein